MALRVCVHMCVCVCLCLSMCVCFVFSCLNGRDVLCSNQIPSGITLKVGDTSQYYEDNGEQTFSVQKFFPHPQYRSEFSLFVIITTIPTIENSLWQFTEVSVRHLTVEVVAYPLQAVRTNSSCHWLYVMLSATDTFTRLPLLSARLCDSHAIFKIHRKRSAFQTRLTAC